MFNIKTFTFEFSDISIYCVGSKGNIDMLHLFYIAHKNSIDPDLFLKRIIKCGVLAYFEGKNPIYTFKAQKYNNLLKKNKSLFDIDYLEEATLLSEPHKVIKALELQELYGKELDVSPYLIERFPTLPPKYIINPPND